MIEKIKEITEKANPTYIFEYEESSMMNVKVDEIKREDSFVYVEEFKQGRIITQRYAGLAKSMKLQIYFSKFSDLHADAIQREEIRAKIEAEIVYPFITAYNNSGFEKPESWGIYYPLPRFDANETSVMLEFNCIEPLCL